MRLEGLGKLKETHLIGIRTRNFPACSIVPQPTTLPRALKKIVNKNKTTFYAKYKRFSFFADYAMRIHFPTCYKFN
jgi:hypothetical protein